MMTFAVVRVGVEVLWEEGGKANEGKGVLDETCREEDENKERGQEEMQRRRSARASYIVNKIETRQNGHRSLERNKAFATMPERSKALPLWWNGLVASTSSFRLSSL